MTGLFENIQRSVDPTVILLMVAVIAVCATVFMCVTWNVEPWTRKVPEATQATAHGSLPDQDLETAQSLSGGIRDANTVQGTALGR